MDLCVADRERSRRFYEGLLGFKFWWDLELPDEATATLLQLSGRSEFTPPIWSATAWCSNSSTIRSATSEPRPQRVMDEVGLTHMSFSVSDLAGVLAKVEGFGGTLVPGAATEQFAMIRDPDGQLIELLPDTWLANLPPRP